MLDANMTAASAGIHYSALTRELGDATIAKLNAGRSARGLR